MTQLSERDIRRQIEDWLAVRHILFEKMHTGGAKVKGQWMRFGTPGRPDIWAVKDGHAIFIEVKTVIGKLRPEQIEYREKVIRAGGTYIEARCLEDVVRQIP